MRRGQRSIADGLRKVAFEKIGQGWHVVTGAAFVTMVVRRVVFFALQRFFVRGLLVGAVKG